MGTIFEYLDYKKFLLDLIDSSPNRGRGVRKKMADGLNCQMAFITHVLNGDKDFSLEQAIALAKTLALKSNETEFFIDLVSMNRSGTAELKQVYQNRLIAKKKEFQLLKNRLNENQILSLESQAIYYSHWLYGAIHMATTIPELQTLQELKKFFNIREDSLIAVLTFLKKIDLVRFEKEKYICNKLNLYIPKGSPFESHHHMIWRIKALQDLKSSNEDDFRYSLCFSVNKKDWPKLREILIESINKSLEIIRPSKEEKLGLINIDFQSL